MAKKSAEEVLEEIKKLLWWDHDNECWKDRAADPGWVGLDELCEIDRILLSGGHGV